MDRHFIVPPPPAKLSCVKSKPVSMKTTMLISSRMEKHYTVLHGLKYLCEPSRYKVWLLDQFGVLHDGQNAYAGAIDTLNRIASTGVKLVVISNSSRRAVSTFERMEKLGFDPSLFSGVITSGELTHEYLLRRHDPWFAKLGRKCIHITWTERSSISLEGLDLEVVENPEVADFILAHGTEALGLGTGGVRPASLDELETILKLSAGRGIPMVVANPDYVTVEARDLKIMPGSLGLKYEKLGGYVQYMGKPDSVVYQAAAVLTGEDFRDMIAVGDSLCHDIQGGAKSHIDSVFVAGGIHAAELHITHIGQQPTPQNLDSLFKMKDICPTYVVPMFTW